jgi:hypothetical protein
MVSRPEASMLLRASRTEIRLAWNCSVKARSGGSLSPGCIAPLKMALLICRAMRSEIFSPLTDVNRFTEIPLFGMTTDLIPRRERLVKGKAHLPATKSQGEVGADGVLS